MDVAEASGRSRKRSQQQVSLEVVNVEEGVQSPILAYFPTPYDPCSKDDSTELYASAKNRQMQLVVRSAGNVDFVGHNSQGEAAGWTPTTYALGVFDKDEGSLKIIPATSDKMFRMEPRVRGISYAMDYGNEKNEEIDSSIRLARKINLVNRFGIKRSQNQLQKAARGIVKETALGASDEQFKGFLEDATKQEGLLLTKKDVFESANAAVVRKIPPHNFEATKPEDAYPLDRIISPDEWHAMDADVGELGKASRKPALIEELRCGFKYWDFVIDRLPRIRVENDREGNARRARILVYLNHLLSLFHATRGRIVPGRNPFLDDKTKFDIPPPIYEKLKAMFIQEVPAGTDRGGRILYRDYLLSYILVLAHKVDGFSSEVAVIAKNLKMTVADLTPHYAQIGCKIDAHSSKVTLPLPLNLQKIDDNSARKGGGRGRGRGKR